MDIKSEKSNRYMRTTRRVVCFEEPGIPYTLENNKPMRISQF